MQWLNLKDAKPKDGQRVLIYSPMMISSIGGDRSVCVGEFFDVFLRPDGFSLDLARTINAEWWMPLPEPPKGKGK